MWAERNAVTQLLAKPPDAQPAAQIDRAAHQPGMLLRAPTYCLLQIEGRTGRHAQAPNEGQLPRGSCITRYHSEGHLCPALQSR